MSFFFTLGPGFNRKEIIFILLPFASAFQFFEKKCMGMDGINNDLVSFAETFSLNLFLNIAAF